MPYIKREKGIRIPYNHYGAGFRIGLPWRAWKTRTECGTGSPTSSELIQS